MNRALKIGLSFGAASGILTTLGLMTGLTIGTQSKAAVIGGILTIAIADALSDAFGIHISQESQNRFSEKDIWKATNSTFIFKFLFSLTFLIPVLLLNLMAALIVSVVWGLLLIGIFSYGMAKEQNKSSTKIVLEHLALAIVVVGVTYGVGVAIRRTL